jgi:uncharacterized cupredoxin-like copper-binding protein
VFDHHVGPGRRIGVRAHRVAVVVACSILAAACVGEDDPVAGDDGAASTSLEVQASDFSFDPDRWVVPTGEAFEVELENAGTIVHVWAVLRHDAAVEREAELTSDDILLRSEAVNPGTAARQTFTIDEAGSYRVICTIPGHFDAGMVGELTVTDG